MLDDFFQHSSILISVAVDMKAKVGPMFSEALPTPKNSSKFSLSDSHPQKALTNFAPPAEPLQLYDIALKNEGTVTRSRCHFVCETDVIF